MAGERSESTIQFYYDYTRRDIPQTFDERRHTADLDVQQRLTIGTRQNLLWGGGVRMTSDDIGNSAFAAFQPDSRTDWTFSAFLQDRIDLVPDSLHLTLGSKIEHNDYTGYELQPNVRLSWQASEAQTLWAAVSRAVRIPSRLDADLQLTAPLSIAGVTVPIYARVNGTHDFGEERLVAYESGWRWQPTDRVNLDVAGFYNDYDRLQTQEPLNPRAVVVPGPPTYILLPNVLDNGKRAHAYGGTLAASFQPLPLWRVKVDYSFFHIVATPEPWSHDGQARGVEGDTPRHQASLQSYLDLGPSVSLFVAGRYVDALPHQGVGAYSTIDASVQWRPSRAVELALVGRGLTRGAHSEYGTTAPDAIPRIVYGTVTMQF
jgi:iron complex outermembrane receptor protein